MGASARLDEMKIFTQLIRVYSVKCADGRVRESRFALIMHADIQ